MLCRRFGNFECNSTPQYCSFSFSLRRRLTADCRAIGNLSTQVVKGLFCIEYIDPYDHIAAINLRLVTGTISSSLIIFSIVVDIKRGRSSWSNLFQLAILHVRHKLNNLMDDLLFTSLGHVHLASHTTHLPPENNVLAHLLSGVWGMLLDPSPVSISRSCYHHP